MKIALVTRRPTWRFWRIACDRRSRRFARADSPAPTRPTPIRSRRFARAAIARIAFWVRSSYAGGRRGKERAASLRAEQRLAAGGRRLPDPDRVTLPDPDALRTRPIARASLNAFSMRECHPEGGTTEGSALRDQPRSRGSFASSG